MTFATLFWSIVAAMTVMFIAFALLAAIILRIASA